MTANTNSAAATASATTVIWRPKRLICASSGVVSGAMAPSIWLILPISVSVPVAVTTPRAAPAATSVPDQAMPARSPSGASAATAAVDFSATTDSPVSSASSMRSARAVSRRRSAGTRSPASISTTSPGTSASTGSTCRVPPRSTRAWGDSMSRSASMAASALPSCITPTMALVSTTARITPASTQWPSAPATAAPASRKMISALANCAPRRCASVRRGGAGRALGPWRCSRWAASAGVRPWSGAVSRAAATSAAGRAWGTSTVAARRGSGIGLGAPGCRGKTKGLCHTRQVRPLGRGLDGGQAKAIGQPRSAGNGRRAMAAGVMGGGLRPCPESGRGAGGWGRNATAMRSTTRGDQAVADRAVGAGWPAIKR